MKKRKPGPALALLRALLRLSLSVRAESFIVEAVQIKYQPWYHVGTNFNLN